MDPKPKPEPTPNPEPLREEDVTRGDNLDDEVREEDEALPGDEA